MRGNDPSRAPVDEILHEKPAGDDAEEEDKEPEENQGE